MKESDGKQIEEGEDRSMRINLRLERERGTDRRK